MTALILRAMPLVAGFLHALDAFAEATMRNAVPNWPREAQR
jgi:hypothetical protein